MNPKAVTLAFPSTYFIPIPETQLWDWDWHLLWSGSTLDSVTAEQKMTWHGDEIAFLTTYTPGQKRQTFLLVREPDGIIRIELEDEALDTLVESLAYERGIPRPTDVVREVLSYLKLWTVEYWIDPVDTDQLPIPGMDTGHGST